MLDPETISFLLAAISEHKWLGVAVIVLGMVVRLLKSDTKLPINIPQRWLPLATIVLGQAYSVCQMIASGMAWKPAVMQGLKVSLLTMGLFDVVVKAVFNGKDLPVWLGWLLKPADPTDPPADAEKK